MKKKVSFIMPLYNAEKYVKQAIESVLNQTYTDYELLLIDDVSTDHTMEIVNTIRDPRIRLIHNEENMGIAYSRNIGLHLAVGEYIALMDDDDISLPARLEKQVLFLDENQDIDIVGGRYQLIDNAGIVLKEEKKAYNNPMYIKALFLFQNIYSNGEMMFRKKLIDENKICYSDNQYGMEDFKFWIECSKVGRFYTLDEVFLQHRVHETSETNKNKTQNFEMRERHRKELLLYSMALSNISVSEEEIKIIMEYTNNKICKDREALKQYYHALGKVVSQARKNNLDYTKELDKLCRNYYTYQIKKIDNLWLSQCVLGENT